MASVKNFYGVDIDYDAIAFEPDILDYIFNTCDTDLMTEQDFFNE